MSMLRVFTAVEISPEIRSAATRLIERLKAAPAKVTWTKPVNLHYTLKFLGDVPETQLADVCRAVEAAVSPFTPFEIVSSRVGAFPSSSKPRTLWIGVDDGAEPLGLVFQAIERLLKPLGYPPEARRFTAHLTLGRVRENDPSALAALAELLKKHADLDAGAMLVDSVTVFASTLGREGPTYEVLSRADFQG
jgi:RNA 2',3'-cyclic 3'-phosphodiesterase